MCLSGSAYSLQYGVIGGRCGRCQTIWGWDAFMTHQGMLCHSKARSSVQGGGGEWETYRRKRENNVLQHNCPANKAMWIKYVLHMIVSTVNSKQGESRQIEPNEGKDWCCSVALASTRQKKKHYTKLWQLHTCPDTFPQQCYNVALIPMKPQPGCSRLCLLARGMSPTVCTGSSFLCM